MANMSNYLENKIIDSLFRGATFTPPSTLYIALCTSSPTDSSTGSTLPEVSGGNYARRQIDSDSTNWAATDSAGSTAVPSGGTSGTTSNNVPISWDSVTWTGTVAAVAICDASTNGNVFFWGSLTESRNVSSGNNVTFDAGTLTVRID